MSDNFDPFSINNRRVTECCRCNQNRRDDRRDDRRDERRDDRRDNRDNRNNNWWSW